MGPFDALDHIVNFFLPALGMALLLPSLARVVWRAPLKSVAWLHQVRWAAAANALVLIVGLIVTGRDGAMVTYAGLVLASALTVWWTGLR
ncbi:hypothetical protein [Aquabacterium sp.]|jgi:hypothetical protein|uniref:hypothetical protein n=1 Tax=Aquabacterium sp. TaxID=1872578 RepID=UPI0025BB2115|nr:hypothetical protein [Aquabacterium sp.]